MTRMRIEVLDGDITQQQVDVIVNAANSSLLGGGGVDGAIHAKGGREILDACRDLRADRYTEGLPTGQAVATTAGRLPARWVVHTVGPRWSATQDRSALLRACYANSLEVAEQLRARSIAFPLISAGIYGWPVEDAVRQALGVLVAAETEHLTDARFVLFGRPAYDLAVAVHQSLDR